MNCTKGEAGVKKDHKARGKSDKVNGERVVTGEMKQE